MSNIYTIHQINQDNKEAVPTHRTEASKSGKKVTLVPKVVFQKHTSHKSLCTQIELAHTQVFSTHTEETTSSRWENILPPVGTPGPGTNLSQ